MKESAWERNKLIIHAYFFVVLAIIIIVIAIIQTISFIIVRVRNNTKVNALINATFLLFAISIIYDCIRTVILVGLGSKFPDLDAFGYVAKCILIFISFILVSRVILLLGNYVGFEQKHKSLIQLCLISLAVIFSVLNVYGYYITPGTDHVFYIYQFDPVLYLAIFLAYLPLGFLIFSQNIRILRAISNKKIYYRLIMFTILSMLLIGERAYSLGGYGLAYTFLNIPTELSLTIDLGTLTIISIMFIIIALKFPDIFEKIGTYFSIKKLYVLKNSGVLLFEYNFQEKKLVDGYASEESLVGGFVYAVSEGFREILMLDEEINSFSSGDRSVLIHHGIHTFAVLIVTEESPLMHQKLKEFITKYEEQNRKDLEMIMKTGDLSHLNRLDILELIFKTLRED